MNSLAVIYSQSFPLWDGNEGQYPPFIGFIGFKATYKIPLSIPMGEISPLIFKNRPYFLPWLCGSVGWVPTVANRLQVDAGQGTYLDCPAGRIWKAIKWLFLSHTDLSLSPPPPPLSNSNEKMS